MIIIGLGNPGTKFKNTRHNIGFQALDKFAKENNFPEFKLQKKFIAEISESQIASQKIILAKPQTFMNESGKSAQKITTHYKLQTTNLLVVHDDIDLPTGEIKISKNRGSAGHKGVESIIKEVNSSDFIRFRIGIKPNQSYGSDCRTGKAKDIVLQKFLPEEKQSIENAIKKTCEALLCLIENGLEKTMNLYN